MSKEQWGHGYNKGLQDGMKSLVSLYDYIVLKYKDDDSPYGDLAQDMIRQLELLRRLYPDEPDSRNKSSCINSARTSSCSRVFLQELEGEWKLLGKGK